MRKSILPTIFLAFMASSICRQATGQTPFGCDGQYYVSYGNSSGDPNSTTSVDKLSVVSNTISAANYPVNPTGIGFNGLGINPVDGYMYGLRYANANDRAHLIRISAGAPGTITDLGELNSVSGLDDGEHSYAACFNAAGTLYFTTGGNQFYRIAGLNYPAVNLTPILIDADLGIANTYFVDIAIDPTTNIMYGTTFNSGAFNTTRQLRTIDMNNGNNTLIGNHNGSSYIASLFFDEVGNLYGYRSNGTFVSINKTNSSLTNVGTAPSYEGADGCSCSFGRVFHDLDFTANPGNQLCPTLAAPTPTFPMTVTVFNQTSSQKTSLTYTLSIADPAKRFRFTEPAATIKSNLITAGVATAASTVTLFTDAPAVGTNYNRVVVTGFQTGGPTVALNFTLQVQLYTLGGAYNNVPLQSVISGLPAAIGLTDQSNDPGTVGPDDPTVITFCPNVILPVNFTSFTAYRNNSTVMLKWQTSIEANSAGFAVERNINGTWQQVAFVNSQAAGGNSNSPLNYSYADQNMSKGISQYRIRQVDLDDQSKYSEIRSVRGEGQTVKTLVYPNPTTDGKVNIVFEDGVAGVSRDISLADMSGRVIKQMKGVTNNNLTLDNLTPGIYSLRIFIPATGEQSVEKIVVNKR